MNIETMKKQQNEAEQAEKLENKLAQKQIDSLDKINDTLRLVLLELKQLNAVRK